MPPPLASVRIRYSSDGSRLSAPTVNRSRSHCTMVSGTPVRDIVGGRTVISTVAVPVLLPSLACTVRV